MSKFLDLSRCLRVRGGGRKTGRALNEVEKRVSGATDDEGSVAERSNAADCKSAGYAFAGSNPARPTIFLTISNIATPAATETLSEDF